VQQAQQGLALAHDVGIQRLAGAAAAPLAIAGAQRWGRAQGLNLALQPREAHRRLGQHAVLGQRGARVFAKGAGLQRIEREHAPGLAVHVQPRAHAVVHRQRLANQRVEQAVIRVGELAVVVKTGHFAARQDGRQPRVLADGKAPPQGLAHQTVHCQGAQVFSLQLQQRHRATVKLLAQVSYQALQAHGLGQVRRQVGQQQGGQGHGSYYPSRVKCTMHGKGENHHGCAKSLIGKGARPGPPLA
jgi:hypothetical protein